MAAFARFLVVAVVGDEFAVFFAASPFLAKRIQMSFAGFGFPPSNPPARAQHCALVGGYMRKEQNNLLWGGCPGHPGHLSTAAFAGCSVPFHTSPPSRGALRSAGVPTIAASTTPAPRLPGDSARGRGIWEDSEGAREYPMCAEGWAMWVLGGSPDLSKATGGTYRLGKPLRLNLPGGPPLGALRRCLRVAFAPRSHPPTALWGIQEGKADVTRGETGERRTSCAATRALCPPTQ